MSLVSLWTTASEELREKGVGQVIGLAGKGKLLDDSDASAEFRSFLSHVPVELLDRYANECLAGDFKDNGLALQDVVNEIGKRLQFEVTEGRYRGSPRHIGHDGLWRSEDGHEIVVEVKTTDAYRIDLNTLADYRSRLMEAGRLSATGSSILIVVGREDTGDLEAQIRGSRHAWDIRMIGVDGLLRLLHVVTQEIESPETARKVAAVLMPREFTRVDGILDLVFATTEEASHEPEPEEEISPRELDVERRPGKTPARFNRECANRVAQSLKTTLNPKTRSIFSTPDGQVVVVSLVSREYPHGESSGYWYGFHDYQIQALSKAAQGHIALGCGSEEDILLVPWRDLEGWLVGMNTTERPSNSYWHIHIFRSEGKYSLRLKEGYSDVDLTHYKLHRPPGS